MRPAPRCVSFMKQALLEGGIVQVSQGAVVYQPPVSFGSNQGSDREAPPMLLRKSDGSSLCVLGVSAGGTHTVACLCALYRA